MSVESIKLRKLIFIFDRIQHKNASRESFVFLGQAICVGKITGCK